jgi:hypothetical protein
MIDESGGILEAERIAKAQRRGVRTQTIGMWGLASGFDWIGSKSPQQRLANLGTILRYIINGVLSHRGKRFMDVDKLSSKWVEAIAGMCTAHDKDTYDRHDAMADELLSPILASPIKQVREFYPALQAKLRADPRIPFLVWIGFEAWGEMMVKGAADEGILRLKKKLAADIAALVEKPAAEQLPEAIKRALCWRDPEVLQEVKTALKDGAKPKLVGRQSCLFLECQPRGKKEKVSVML